MEPSVDVRHFQFCTKRYRHHARIGSMSHLFHTGLARNRTIFAMTQHFSKLGDTPFWHLCVPKGAEMTSLRGGEPFAPLPAGFRRLLWPPLSEHYLLLCLLTCMCNQLHGLCYKKGIFHGMIYIATTDPL